MGPSTLSFLALTAFLLAVSARAGGYGDQPASATDDGYFDRPAYEEPVDGLDYDYYNKSCSDMEGIIQRAVKKAFDADYTIAPSLIRLFFHDCAIGGCDGSILIDAPGSERYANSSKTLRGFKLIEEIKEELEKRCPRTVSCADILTAVARDATHMVDRRQYWQVKYGRKDGRVSLAGEAEKVPMGRESVTSLIEFFISRGLTLIDLVVLSGAHTIGRSSCRAVRPRLLSCNGHHTTEDRYADYVRRRCGGAAEYVDLDATSPTTFDEAYYKNLMHGMGLLGTDQALFGDSRTGPTVRALANQDRLFVNQFAVSMARLSRVQVLTGNDGEVRLRCSAFNY